MVSRVGRALIHTLLARRGLTTEAARPVSLVSPPTWPTSADWDERLNHSRPRKARFSLDGKLLTSASENGARLWDLSTGQSVPAPLIHQRVPTTTTDQGNADTCGSRAWSSARTKSLLTTGGGTTRLWGGLWDDEAGCAIATRYVDRAQLDPYLPSGWPTACTYRE